MPSVNCKLLPAGVVGLAVAQKLSLQGYQVQVYEHGETFGTQTSGRNSCIIHSGTSLTIPAPCRTLIGVSLVSGLLRHKLVEPWPTLPGFEVSFAVLQDCTMSLEASRLSCAEMAGPSCIRTASCVASPTSSWES